MHQGHQAHINHGHQGQANDQPGPFARSIWHDGQGKAQKAISTQFEHDGRQNGRATGGRFDVHIGQPGVHRPHRYFDGKSSKERKEQQGLGLAAQGQLVPNRQIKAATRLCVEVNQGHQHQQRAEQGVEEKLKSSVDFVRATPNANDEVHRDQGGFKEHIEQHGILGGENPHHQATEDQKSPHVLVDTFGDDFPSRQHHHGGDESGEQHQPQRDAIHTQVVMHLEAFDPQGLFHPLHLSAVDLKAAIQRQGDQKADQCTEQCQPAHCLGMLIPPQGEQQATNNNRRPNGQAQQTHVLSLFVVIGL